VKDLSRRFEIALIARGSFGTAMLRTKSAVYRQLRHLHLRAWVASLLLGGERLRLFMPQRYPVDTCPPFPLVALSFDPPILAFADSFPTGLSGAGRLLGGLHQSVFSFTAPCHHFERRTRCACVVMPDIEIAATFRNY
jgi:hypothetical protein